MNKQNSKILARTWPYSRFRYFENALRISAKEWFANKGFQTHPKMQYCMATHDQWPNNIICSDVVEYIRKEQKRHNSNESFPLHKYLHHGLSSQAMVFNLIGPLIVRNDLIPLKNAIKICQVKWPEGDVSAGFEYSDRQVFNEDSGQPTSIDLTISGEYYSLFIEAKLAEREFGGCSVFADGDCEGGNPYPSELGNCYLHHIGRKYWQCMDEQGFNKMEFNKGLICPFANYYQFYREILFALAKGGRFILLFDSRSPVFIKKSKDGHIQKGLWQFLFQSIPHDKRKYVGHITIQEIVHSIEECGRHQNWIDEFKIKYGLS